jgi:arabinan endo-1,5-alpha-L-arabinosidase
VFATGSARGDGNIQIRRSDDQGSTWTFVDTVWNEKPAWLADTVPGVANLWAPELIEHDGTWYLYYAASTFGSNHSVIGLATNATLDASDADYEWVDQGPVLASETSDDFNAIDPGVVDVEGTPWMSFGSFWSGIRMVELEWPSGMLADPGAEPLRLADRGSPPNAIEAPYVVEHDGWFYLFVSKDSCCQGLNSTYSMWVGRSETVTGPYVDRDGVPMLEDGGTLLLETDGDEIGPGGQSVSNGWLAYHFYDGANGGDPTLAIRSLTWDADGWPVLGQ